MKQRVRMGQSTGQQVAEAGFNPAVYGPIAPTAGSLCC